MCDVRLVPAEDDARAIVRRYGRAQLLSAVGFLRARNAAGMHVYGLPACDRAILVDDLDADALDALRTRHRIAAVVETSPANRQAWIRIGAASVPASLATAAARLLARRHGGAVCAARQDQVGRLPGFTNRKGLHRGSDGLHPYALLREARGGTDGARLLEAARAELARPREAPGTVVAPEAAGPPRRPPAEGWREGAARVAAGLPPGAALDRSRADYAIASRLLRRGTPQDRVAAVLLAGARAAAMPPQAAAAYVARTLRAAVRGGT